MFRNDALSKSKTNGFAVGSVCVESGTFSEEPENSAEILESSNSTEFNRRCGDIEIEFFHIYSEATDRRFDIISEPTVAIGQVYIWLTLHF